MIRVLINKFTFMKDSKQSFKDLVKKMNIKKFKMEFVSNAKVTVTTED